MAKTYEKIATTTLGSAASSITFSSIAASWTDLRVVLLATTSTSGTVIRMQHNSDSTSVYSFTELYGSGSAVSADNGTSSASINISDSNVVGSSTTIPSMITIDIFSYAGSTYKTSLITESQDYNGTGAVTRTVGLWRSTSAITAVNLFPASGNFNIGTTATLYGIKAA
jgi:hypothetical protein